MSGAHYEGPAKCLAQRPEYLSLARLCPLAHVTPFIAGIEIEDIT